MLQAFFAASEIALVSADECKIHAETESGPLARDVLGKLLANRDRLLALVLTTNNLATVIAAVAADQFSAWHPPPLLRYLAPFILAPLTLMLGESIPKLLALTIRLSIRAVRRAAVAMLATILLPLLAVETLAQQTAAASLRVCRPTSRACS